MGKLGHFSVYLCYINIKCFCVIITNLVVVVVVVIIVVVVVIIVVVVVVYFLSIHDDTLISVLQMLDFSKISFIC